MFAIGLLLTLVAQGAEPTPITVTTIAAGAPLQGVEIGAKRDAALLALKGLKVEDITDNEILVYNAMSLDGLVAEQTYITFLDGKVVQLRTDFSGTGPDVVKGIQAKADALCKPFEPAERYHPMPPTPRPGLPPPPNQTRLTCHGPAGGVLLEVSESRTWRDGDSPIDSATLAVTLRVNPPSTP